MSQENQENQNFCEFLTAHLSKDNLQIIKYLQHKRILLKFRSIIYTNKKIIRWILKFQNLILLRYFFRTIRKFSRTIIKFWRIILFLIMKNEQSWRKIVQGQWLSKHNCPQNLQDLKFRKKSLFLGVDVLLVMYIYFLVFF